MRAGIIGFGQIVHGHIHAGRLPLFHLEAYAALAKRVEVVAVAEPDAMLREYAATLLPHARMYMNHSEMLASEKLDVVSICSPDNMHARHLLDVAEARVRGVWCEKPVAVTPAELEALGKASGSMPKVQLNYWRRFIPEISDLKEMIASNEFGSINCVTGYYPDGWFRNGSHLIDLMDFLVGELEVTACLSAGGLDEDVGLTTIGIGRAGFTWSAMSIPRNRYNLLELDIHCQKARLRVVRNGREVEIVHDGEDPDFQHLRILDSRGQLSECAWRQSFTKALDNLVDCIEGKVSHMTSSLDDALRVARLVVTAKESGISRNNLETRRT